MKQNLLLFTLLSFTTSLFAEVLSWRNDGTGGFTDTTPPTDWSAPEATLWSTPFEESNASAIFADNKLFFMEEPSALVCVDSESGELLWRKENGLLNLLGLSEEEIKQAEATIAESERLDKAIDRKLYEVNRMGRSNLPQEERDQKMGELLQEYMALGKEKEALSANDPYGETVMPAAHPSNGYTSYTPVSDGERIFACFGSGAVVAYDFSGERLWHRVLDDTDHIFGGSVSPLLVENKLIVKFSDYVALDPSTGEELWRTPANVNFGTPIHFSLENQAFLFTSRGVVIRVSDGEKLTEELVHIENEQMDWTVFNSPVLQGQHLFTVRGINGEEGHAYHFRIPDTVTLLETEGLELIWKKDIRKSRYYASPLIHDGLLYAFSDNSWLSVLEADTGDLVYEHRLKGMKGVTYPSLVLTGDMIFAGSETGNVTFFKPGRAYEEIATSEIVPYRSTPIFIEDKVYVRTREDIRAIQ